MNNKCPYCLLARVFVVTGIGVFLSWLILTDWFAITCIGRCYGVAEVLFAPAELIRDLIGSGMDEENDVNFTIGVIIELWILWSAGEWGVKAVKRRTT